MLYLKSKPKLSTENWQKLVFISNMFKCTNKGKYLYFLAIFSFGNQEFQPIRFFSRVDIIDSNNKLYSLANHPVLFCISQHPIIYTMISILYPEYNLEDTCTMDKGNGENR